MRGVVRGPFPPPLSSAPSPRRGKRLGLPSIQGTDRRPGKKEGHILRHKFGHIHISQGSHHQEDLALVWVGPLGGTRGTQDGENVS